MRVTSIFAFMGVVALAAGCQEPDVGGGGGDSTSTTTTTSTTDSTTTTTSDTSSLDPANFPPADPAQFIVTIQNNTAQSMFMRAGLLYPFAIVPTGGADYVFYVDCPCSVCGTNMGCGAKDLLLGFIELPAGESVAVDATLVHYVDHPYAVAACSELGPQSGLATCPLATTILPGSDYEIRVDYAFVGGPKDGDLKPAGVQWGKPYWSEKYALATIPLPNSVIQPLTIAAGGPTEVQIDINP